MEKKLYTSPELTVVNLEVNRNLLLVVSGSETDMQLAPSQDDDLLHMLTDDFMF